MNANNTPDTVPAPTAVLAPTVLVGHVSEETAYVVGDYPYGFRLRCQIRYWIETTKRGQRLCTQTSNPKRPGLVWNKPKKSVYYDIAVLLLGADGRVTHDVLSQGYSGEERIDAFESAYAVALADERSQKELKFCRAVIRAQKHVIVTVRAISPGETVQTREEQQAIMRAAVGRELRAMAPKKGSSST